MYHVAGTGLTVLSLYLISYFLYKTGFYPLLYHRKIWNTVLAFAFAVTALAGVFLALQVSYKWEIPIAKSILKWHVEFGIAMTVTGIFHSGWHLAYFKKLFKSPDIIELSKDPEKLNKDVININLFIVGFVSTAIQLLLLREMMNIAGGYELIAGVFLASWLILSSLGASIAGHSLLSDLRLINLVFFFSPLVSLCLFILFSRLFLGTGESPSFLVSIIYTFVVLCPICILSGFIFVKLITEARNTNHSSPGSSFSIETAGGVASGIIVSILSAGLLNTYQTLITIILLYGTYILTTFYIRSNKAKTILKVMVLFLSSTVIVFNPDLIFRRLMLPGINVTDSKDTPYGNITTGRYYQEQSIYYNHKLLSFNNDLITSEENIHYAMLQSQSPEKVLLISGSLKSHLSEILKYKVENVTFIERDPELTAIYQTYPGNISDKLSIQNVDVYSYLRSPGELSDVIIMLLPPPSTLLLSRYYTTEFFSSVKKRLKPDGIFMCSPGNSENYLNDASINLYSAIYNSLGAVFKNVKPVSGNKFYLLSSDKELSVSFCKLTETKNIKNKYVCSDYLSDEITNSRTEEVTKLINKGKDQNLAAFPIACLHFQEHFLSRNYNEKIPALVLLIMIFAVPVLFIKRRNMIMYTCASALAGFEIIILFTLQIIIGNMYQLTGLIVAGLMSGLAAGAGIETGFLRNTSLKVKGYLIMSYYLVFGLLYNNIANLKSDFLSLIIVIISAFIPAFFTGHLFRELSETNEGSNKVSDIYSADLAGSATGFILITGIAVPILGIQVSLYLLAMLIFAGNMFGTIRNK